jgi:hypothetical protein
MAILFQLSGSDGGEGFRRSARKMRSAKSALAFLGEEEILRNSRRLRSGVDVDGVPFKPSRRAGESGGQTLSQTGALGASMNYAAADKQLDLYSTDKRARVHYEGLEVRPKKGMFLTIPLRAGAGMFGGAMFGLDVKANRLGDRAGHYSKSSTFFAWRGGKLFLFQKTSSKTIRALFLLVRSVQMPARRWFGFSKDDLELATKVLGDHVTGHKQ